MKKERNMLVRHWSHNIITCKKKVNVMTAGIHSLKYY